MERTKLPWKIKKCSCGYCTDYWIEPVGKFVQGSGFSETDARFIITACNNHSELLEACKDLVSLCEHSGSFANGVEAFGVDEGLAQAATIIKKAEQIIEKIESELR